MRKGNLIACLSLIPFVIVVYLLLANAGTHVKHEGALIICAIFSFFSLPFSVGYLVISNGDCIEKTSVVQFVYKHRMIVRAVVLVIGSIVFLAVSFTPNNHKSTLQTGRMNTQR
jgi:hypothetical protein